MVPWHLQLELALQSLGAVPSLRPCTASGAVVVAVVAASASKKHSEPVHSGDSVLARRCHSCRVSHKLQVLHQSESRWAMRSSREALLQPQD